MSSYKHANKCQVTVFVPQRSSAGKKMLKFKDVCVGGCGWVCVCMCVWSPVVHHTAVPGQPALPRVHGIMDREKGADLLSSHRYLTNPCGSRTWGICLCEEILKRVTIFCFHVHLCSGRNSEYMCYTSELENRTAEEGLRNCPVEYFSRFALWPCCKFPQDRARKMTFYAFQGMLKHS